MISVIILTFNSVKFIKPCLDALLSQAPENMELVVVDNGSNDGTGIFIKKNYPRVYLIENKLNLGPARGRNQGIEKTRGEWILSLDCDVVLHKDFFSRIGSILESLPPEVGLLQPKIMEFNGKRIYSAGISVSFLRRFFDIGKGRLDCGQFEENKYVFGACSAAALYRREMLDRIRQAGAYFDESFFFLFEDLDLSWRARNKGYKTMFFPKAVCYHQGDSSGTAPSVRQYLCLRNRYYALLKNDSMKNCILPFLVYDLPRLAWISVVNPAALKALKDAFVYRGKLKAMPAHKPGLSVSVIIVTSGSKDYLWRCLDSLKAQSYTAIETIVVDNSLDPALAARVRACWPSVIIHSNRQNLYYGSSLNRGIEASQGEFVLCLNDDVSLDRDFIRQAIQGFLIKDSIGMVSGKILRLDGLTLDSTGLFLSISYTARERGYGQRDAGRFENPGFVFGVSGAAAFYRRAMLEDIKEGGGYFDPRFQMFYEDLDISWRAKRHRWEAYYIPSAKAFHARGGSLRPDSGLNKPLARRYINDHLHSELIKNRYLTILKNASPFVLLLHLIPVLLYDLCAWGYILVFRRRTAKILLRSLKSFFRFRFRK